MNKHLLPFLVLISCFSSHTLAQNEGTPTAAADDQPKIEIDAVMHSFFNTSPVAERTGLGLSTNDDIPILSIC